MTNNKQQTTTYPFEFRPYRRPFVRTLSTSHGNWDVREGIILRLTNETGRVGWGEIAPISWFGSETLEQALDFCQQLPPEITSTDVFSIPAELPACQFGFESAWQALTDETNFDFRTPRLLSKRELGEAKVRELNFGLITNPKSKIAYSCLLPTGEAAIQ